MYSKSVRKSEHGTTFKPYTDPEYHNTHRRRQTEGHIDGGIMSIADCTAYSSTIG